MPTSQFNRCTGARVSVTYNGPDAAGDEDAMAQDLQDDVGVRYNTANGEFVTHDGAGIFDGKWLGTKCQKNNKKKGVPLTPTPPRLPDPAAMAAGDSERP